MSEEITINETIQRIGVAEVGLLAHTHDIEDVSGLQTELDNKSELGHTHVIEDVSGLREELDSLVGGGIGDGDKGDVIVSGAGTVFTIDSQAVTYAKIQNVSATDKILGRSTAGAGTIEEIACTAAGRALLDDVDASAQRTTLGLGTLATQSGTFSGTSSGTNTGDQTITLTGDVTGSGTGSFAATIANDAVSNVKLANMAANTIKGNNTGGSADPVDLTVAQTKTLLAISSSDVSGLGSLATASSVNLSTQASGTLQAAQAPAHTGDVTSSAGSLALTVANDAVTFAKIQNSSGASVLVGRGSAAGAGDFQEITLGTNLSMSGTTLNASGGGLSDGDKGDITVGGSGTTLTIDNQAVTYAKIQNVSATSRLLGRSTAGAGSIEEISLGDNLSLSSGVLSAEDPTIFKVLTADENGQNVNTVQPWFPTSGAVTLEASTSYFFEGLLMMTNGTTTHTTSTSFGGTATLTSIAYRTILASIAANSANSSSFHSWITQASAVVLNTTSAAAAKFIYVNGIVRINGAGTLIPQFTFSAAPGSAPAIKANSYFKLWKIGTNTVATRGTWA